MTRLRKVLLGCGALVSMACVTTQAHHSFPATYLIDQQITVEGKVVQFMFRNPHSFIHVMAHDKDGKDQRWSVEWAAGSALSDRQITRETLKIGDQVVIVGNPGRNPSDHRIRLQAITRPGDGWSWKGSFE